MEDVSESQIEWFSGSYSLWFGGMPWNSGDFDDHFVFFLTAACRWQTPKPRYLLKTEPYSILEARHLAWKKYIPLL